ncbi:hypothetical protein NDU88_001831 [Pleurodeles waltl]|uniref:Uncharacterized protein n=1 Tax=Pleurodeles waltl TaxID=8319 RepID=A0AAV7NEJ3_PLEWA|nr:hypothetical protein NDU88_001831 [Pleurodeles waltl]
MCCASSVLLAPGVAGKHPSTFGDEAVPTRYPPRPLYLGHQVRPLLAIGSQVLLHTAGLPFSPEVCGSMLLWRDPASQLGCASRRKGEALYPVTGLPQRPDRHLSKKQGHYLRALEREDPLYCQCGSTASAG